MQNPKFQIESSYGHTEFKSGAWKQIGGNLIGYTFMQNLRLKVQNTIKSSWNHH